MENNYYNQETTQNKKKKLSDSMVDCIAIIIVLGSIIGGVVYWLNSLPS